MKNWEHDYYNVKFISIGITRSGTVLTLAADVEQPNLRICIGEAEAQSISICLKKIKVPRPMTHDLSLSLLESSGGEVERVLISKRDLGVYYAEIHLRTSTGRKVIDSRPSDAIAIAIRCRAPILFHKSLAILEKVEGEKNDCDCYPEEPSNAAQLRDELQRKLHNAIEHENFELAAMLRDEVEGLDKKT